MCLAVLWSEQAYLGLLAVSSLVLDHARACEAVGLSAGRRFFALVSRGGSSPCTLLFARKLRGRLLSSPFPAVGVGGFFEAARPCLCLSHRHRFFALSLRSGSSPSLLFVGVFGHLLPCVFSFSAMGVSGLVEVCSPFGPLFSPACLAMLGLFWCFESCWYFCWAPLLRAQPARRYFALRPSVCLCASQFSCLCNLIEVCSPSRPQFRPTL